MAAQPNCEGSNRGECVRWRFGPCARNGFIELENMKMEPPELWNRLENVDGVTKVAWTHRGSKASQENPDPYPEDPTRGHRQQQRFEVWFDEFPENPVEFELTRSK